MQVFQEKRLVHEFGHVGCPLRYLCEVSEHELEVHIKTKGKMTPPEDRTALKYSRHGKFLLCFFRERSRVPSLAMESGGAWPRAA